MNKAIVFYVALATVLWVGIVYGGQSARSKKIAALKKNNFTDLIEKEFAAAQDSAFPELKGKSVLMIWGLNAESVKKYAREINELGVSATNRWVVVETLMRNSDFKALFAKESISPSLIYRESLPLTYIKQFIFQVYVEKLTPFEASAEASVLMIDEKGNFESYEQGEIKTILAKLKKG